MPSHTKERLHAKQLFRARHRHLVNLLATAYEEYKGQKIYRSPNGRLLIALAQKELGYSPKTSPCDIFWGIVNDRVFEIRYPFRARRG